jgi:biopolymer transport protein ExbD
MGAKLGGSGGGRYAIGGISDMNVTPMVDVMLVLLIIFMVAAPLPTVSIKLDLPPAQPPTDAKPKPPKIISIQASGEMFIDQVKTDFPTLNADIARALGGDNPQSETVYLRADKAVRYRQFMQVLNTLQDGGFYKISLILEDRT